VADSTRARPAGLDLRSLHRLKLGNQFRDRDDPFHFIIPGADIHCASRGLLFTDHEDEVVLVELCLTDLRETDRGRESGSGGRQGVEIVSLFCSKCEQSHQHPHRTLHCALASEPTRATERERDRQRQ
jgi:hypothetical protein